MRRGAQRLLIAGFVVAAGVLIPLLVTSAGAKTDVPFAAASQSYTDPSGDSGNAPDAIRAGETGYVVPGRGAAGLVAALVGLLTDPAVARAMGEKGMAWVDQEWRWDLVSQRLQRILAG